MWSKQELIDKQTRFWVLMAGGSTMTAASETVGVTRATGRKDTRRNNLGFMVWGPYRCAMADRVHVAESVGRRYAVLRPHLDERQRRLLLGSEAAELGRGGIKAVAEATGAHPDTVARGVRELAGDPEPQVRVRASGDGRKKLSESDPGLLARLKALVDPETRGDPMSLLVWTTKSTRNLAGALTAVGHPVSDRTVARMLASLGFSLQGNADRKSVV